jgi:hypothetical protein
MKIINPSHHIRAVSIVNYINDDLSGMKGIGDLWNKINKETKQNIINMWLEEVGFLIRSNEI